MILVLIPFWTSILVRVAAGSCCCSRKGLVNRRDRASSDQGPLELLVQPLAVYLNDPHSCCRS